MSTLALARDTAKPPRSGAVVRFPAIKAAKPALAQPCLNGVRWPSKTEREAATKFAADALPGLLKDLDAPPIDDAARARLEYLIARRGRETVTLLIRTIIESDGNEDALIEPIIDAVASVMSWHPQWPERGLAWIEAFDDLPLMVILQVMRDLDLFKESNLSRYLSMSLRNKLAKVFEPPPPKPARKPYVYKRGSREPKVEQAAV
jgi:hypothetical protein